MDFCDNKSYDVNNLVNSYEMVILMGNIYLTADLHFGHDREFIYKPRGFENIREHDRALLCNWNEIITEKDEVYLLGDVMLNNLDNGMKLLEQLNGRIHIIRGNHDSNVRVELYREASNVVEVVDAKYFKYKKYNLFLSHYPSLVYNYSDDNSSGSRIINMCGHTHTSDKFSDLNKSLIYHVEVDAHDNYPVLIDDAIQDINEHIHSNMQKL